MWIRDIRYDNIGEQPVSKLVVTDSLAPRLEYVESSQQSSLEARFSTAPNEAGSSVLRWEIDQELKPFLLYHSDAADQ